MVIYHQVVTLDNILNPILLLLNVLFYFQISSTREFIMHLQCLNLFWTRLFVAHTLSRVYRNSVLMIVLLLVPRQHGTARLPRLWLAWLLNLIILWVIHQFVIRGHLSSVCTQRGQSFVLCNQLLLGFDRLLRTIIRMADQLVVR